MKQMQTTASSYPNACEYYHLYTTKGSFSHGGDQAYHSSLNEDPDARQVGNMSILPIKTRIRGPAPVGKQVPHHVSIYIMTNYLASRTLPGGHN